MLGLCHCGQVPVPGARADALALDRLGQRPIDVAGDAGAEALRDGQPPVAAVLRHPVEQPFGALQPRAGLGVAAAVDVVAGELDGHHRGGLGHPGPRGRGVRAFAEVDRLLEAAVPPGRIGIGVQVGRRQRAFRIGLGQLLEGLSPGVARESGAALCRE